MSPHLVVDVFEISIIGQRVSAAVLDWSHTFGLSLDGVHDAHFVDDPKYRRFPVHALGNAL